MSIATTNHRFAVALLCGFWLPFVVPTASADSEAGLWAALQAGGKVVLIRHAPIERGDGSADPRVRDPSCLAEARLSAQGREDAAELGRRFRDHGVPISSVRHSPYCRTTDTAMIAFGQATPASFLSLIEGVPPDVAAERTEELQQAISAHADDGTLVLITHAPNVSAVSFELLSHLDALVLAPDGAGGFEELGIIPFSSSD